MTHGSLFAGIGGFDLGFERAGFETVWQVEIDEYCRRILERHFPRAERFADIHDCGAHNLKRVDVISGGFPCQDISVAQTTSEPSIDGARSGLWAEYLRIICELRPAFVVVENVSALLVRGIERVLGDLAANGYDAEWACFPAAMLGLPQRRWRLFVLAYPASLRFNSGNHEARIFGEAPPEGTRNGESWGLRSFRGNSGRVWQAPESIFDGVDYGIPEELDRLRGSGNAVVPQIAQWIAERIKASV